MSESLRDLVVSLSLQTDNFTRNMQSVNKQIKEAESSFKLASAGVDKFDQDAVALGSQLGALQSKLDLQKTAVEQYGKALEAARDKLQECYTRQTDYAQRLEEAKQRHEQLGEQVQRATAKYEQYKATLGESDSATIAAKQNLDALKEEYKQSGDEVKKLSGQNEALKKATQNAADAVTTATTRLNTAKGAVRETESAIEKCNQSLSLSQTNWYSAGEAIQKANTEITSTGYTASALTQTNNYIAWGTAFSLANTVSGYSGAAGAAVYIKGTLNGSLFTPAVGVLTTTVPTTEDGYTYILLGLMSTSVNAVLAPEHPMFRYYNGGFKAISQIAYEAYVAAEEAQEDIDNLEVGGRNYLLHSDVETESNGYLIGIYEVSSSLEAGQEYTVSMCVSPAEDVSAIGIWLSGGYAKQCQMSVSAESRQIISSTFTVSYYTGMTPDDDPSYANIYVYRLPQPASGSESGTSKIHWIKVEKGNRVTDYTVAPEDAEEALELKLAAVHAQISTEADAIRSEVQATYALSSDMSQVREQVGTLAEQTETNYTWAVTRINELQTDLTAATEATEEQLNTLRTYMTFGEDGLVIGKTGNPFTFRVVNDRLAFYMNNTEVAYLSNNKLYVTQAEILSKLQIGHFTFEPQSNGNLSLIYSG